MKRKNKKKRVLNKQLKRFITPSTILIALIAVAILAGLLSTAINSQATQLERLVTFYDRGQEHVILTRAGTVRDALKDANMTVDPHDVVEPAIDSDLLSSDSAVIIYRARPVLIVDGALRQKLVTAAASPQEIVKVAAIDPLGDKDKTIVTTSDFVADGVTTVLTIERAILTPAKVVYVPKPNALTLSKGAQINIDSARVAHRETYYDLPMNVVIGSCGGGGYTIRAADGAKIDKDGYVLVAANYHIYPRCSIVETSMGPGKVYDTGGFALRYPHGFDLATDWTNRDGR